MRSRTILISVIFFIIGIAAGYKLCLWRLEQSKSIESVAAVAITPTVKPKPILTTITINQAAKTLLYLPLYVAVDQGFLKDSGIEAKIATGGGDSQAFAALLSGEAQFAQGDPTFVAISHEKGGPGRVIASVLDRVAFWGVTFDATLPVIQDGKGFKGLTVVTYPYPNTAYVVQSKILQRANLRLGKDSKIIQATFGTEFGPLKSKAANIAVSIEPNVSQAVSRNGRVVFSYADGWGPFLLTGLMTTEDYIKNNPTIVQNVVSAYEKALRYIRENPKGAAEVGARQFPEVERSVIEMAIARMTNEKVFPEHAAVSDEAWKSALQLRFDLKDLKQMPKTDLRDNSFAEAAKK